MFDLGDVVPLTVEIRDANGALADATAVTLTISLPDGTSVTPSPAHPSTGRYQLDYQSVQAGRHLARWVATGSNASAHVETFDVRPADPGYLMSLAAARAALNIVDGVTVDDDEIRSMLEAVLFVVEDYLREAVVRRTFVDTVCVPGRAKALALCHAPVVSVTSIRSTYDDTEWPLDGVRVVDPAAGLVATFTGAFTGDLTVTYVAGRAVIPANYIEAGKVILKHMWRVQQAPGMGRTVFGGADDAFDANPAYALPNRAKELLGGRGVLLA